MPFARTHLAQCIYKKCVFHWDSGISTWGRKYLSANAPSAGRKPETPQTSDTLAPKSMWKEKSVRNQNSLNSPKELEENTCILLGIRTPT